MSDKVKKIAKAAVVEDDELEETVEETKPVAKAVKKVEAKVEAKAEPKAAAKIDKPVKKPAVVPEKVEAAKKKIIEKKAQVEVKPPEKLVTSLKDIANPIVENRKLKRALAVALATMESDPDKLAALIRRSGIPFKQVEDESHAKNPDLLNKAEWSGRPYANWAIFNKDSYTKKHKGKVDTCMPFAKVLAKAQA